MEQRTGNTASLQQGGGDRMNRLITQSEIQLNAQRYTGYFSIALGVFLIGTIVSSYTVMGEISIYICAAAAAYLILYSVLVFLMTRRGFVSPVLKYYGILTLLVMLTAAKFSFVYGRIGYADVIKETMTFDLYFVIIILSAIYNDKKLTMISGIAAAFLYGTLIAVGALAYGMELATAPEANIAKNQIRINTEIVKCVLLVGAAFAMNTIANHVNRLLASILKSETDAREQARFKSRVIEEVSVKSGNLLAMSRDQSGIEKRFSNSSRQQLESARKLSGHVRTLFDLAHTVTGLISRQTQMSRELGEHVLRVRKWHESASSTAALIRSAGGVINRLSEESSKDMQESIARIRVISEGAARIQEFLSVINDITDRINLLSLNAAIEAARAGEHGRGFSVVADEISKLADATNQQSVEIARYLQKNIEDVRSGEQYILKSSQSFGTIMENIAASQEHLNAIYDIIGQMSSASGLLEENVKQLGDSSESIDRSSKEQSAITGEIKSQVELLVENANLILSGSRELTDISERIAVLSEELKGAIGS